ncbi:MAG: FAD-binding oxidoreductase [Candidatus Dormibacteraeota bacterium]|nr:FAD-binding oxidoreductase [Candidatus Dormibacteraeota bacterium]
MRERAGSSRPPAEVAKPASFEEVQALLGSGRRVLAAGGRSGVCGALDPGPGDLVVDLTGLAGCEIDEANLAVRAQAGLTGQALESKLNERGLTLGHFPSSLPLATVGGLVSTRSSGQQSTLYGSVEDMVIGLTVALPGGQLVEARVHPRTAAGPPLEMLFVGAEGGLGVVLEAVLRVHRLPEAVVGAGWRVPGTAEGLESLRLSLQRGLRPLVLRLYDPEDSVLQGLEGGGCLLLAASAGPAPVAEAEAAVMGELVHGEPLGAEPWERWLRHRFDLSADRLQDLLAPPGAYVDTIEVAASWTDLPALYHEVKAHLAGVADLALCHFSHGYPQGCCAYFTFLGSAADESGAEAAYREAWRGAMEITLAHRGTISHHHGVGQVRAPWIEADMGGWSTIWQRVSRALDPQGLMNPHAVGGLGAGAG